MANDCPPFWQTFLNTAEVELCPPEAPPPSGTPVAYTVGVEQGSGFSNQNHFGYGDDRANSRFYGTMSPSAVFQTYDIRRLAVLDDGRVNLEIFNGGNAIPQDFITSLVLEGVPNTLLTAEATYTPTLQVGFVGQQFTTWFWDASQTGVGDNVTPGWTSGATRDATFYIP